MAVTGGRPHAGFPLSVTDAVGLADWYARYALDCLQDGPRQLHLGVRGHLQASVVQMGAAVTLLDPINDRRAKPMYDGHHEDWVRDDAEQVLDQAEGCGHCPDIAACKAEGACIAHLEAAEPEDLEHVEVDG
jgi:hypothetical protein